MVKQENLTYFMIKYGSGNKKYSIKSNFHKKFSNYNLICNLINVNLIFRLFWWASNKNLN